MKKLAALILALTVPLMANAEIDPEVKKYVNDKLNTVTPTFFVSFDVESTGFRVFDNGYSFLSATLREIKPFGTGSEITFSIVNWMGVALTGVHLRFCVGKKGELPFPTKTESIPLINPGSEVLVKVRFPEKPDQFNAVGLMYDYPEGIEYTKAKQ